LIHIEAHTWKTQDFASYFLLLPQMHVPPEAALTEGRANYAGRFQK
jgi:hypothetical protein